MTKLVQAPISRITPSRVKIELLHRLTDYQSSRRSRRSEVFLRPDKSRSLVFRLPASRKEQEQEQEQEQPSSELADCIHVPPKDKEYIAR
jgi:hypothetical protein